MNNSYGSVPVPPNTPTIVNSLTVPARSGYSFKGVIIWAEIDCEIIVKYNLNTIGGGLLTGAKPTLVLDYSASPYGLNAGDTILVFATQSSSSTYTVKSTMLMEQL